MTRISPLRRLATALTAVACSSVLFRGDVASALVTRGDDVLRAGDADGAIRYYGRAAWLDGGCAAAADRLAFALLLRRGPGDAARALRAADSALRAHPGDALLLADRAFAAQRLTRRRAAERDFAAAARSAHDPRYAHLAARMALVLNDTAAARVHLADALAIDSAYAPSRALLASLPR